MIFSQKIRGESFTEKERSVLCSQMLTIFAAKRTPGTKKGRSLSESTKMFFNLMTIRKKK